MVTDDNGVALAILTADCVPILMVAARRRIAMALHAGWRGTLAGIAAVAVREAAELFGVAASEWQAALGPAIGGCCYEVSREIGDRLSGRWGDMPDAWEPNQDHGHLDLRMANRHILEGVGVPIDAIADVGSCTSCHPDLYFSHRASGGRAGRQLSIIGWRD
jgi:YfiH family protein